MKKKLTYFSLITVLSSLQVVGQVKAYPIDSWHSKVGFSVHFGGLFDVEGRFTDFHGTILFDENDLTKLSATVIVSPASVNTGVNMRDNHLKSEDFFDTEEFPEIIFSSKKTMVKDGKYTLIGDLTMHGITKEISIPFSVIHGAKEDPWKNTRVSISGNFTLNRTDFRIGETGDIGEEVNVNLLISARIFNTQTIGLFSRPFGEEMIDKFLNQGVDRARAHFLTLKEKEDPDTKKPSSFTFLHLRFTESNRTDLAIEACKLGLEFFPKYAPLHTSLGDSYYVSGKVPEAIRAFNNALEIDKSDTMALEMLKLLKE